MRNKFFRKWAIVGLSLSSFVALGAYAQTADDGPGPSEQPSAPMEMGQPQPPQAPAYDQARPAQMPPDQAPGDQAEPEQPQMGEAQPGGPAGEGPAKTDQGVGRISMIHGDVSTQRGDSGTWSAAVLNQPVVNGDKVSTGEGARAEVQLDYSNILRLGTNSQASLANFTHNYIQVQLGQGLATYSVFGESQAEPEIDTPNVSIHPAHVDGVYRVEVRPDGDTIVIVRKGEAQIATPQGIADVKQGEMATVRGAGADARYKVSSAPERDDWDRWNTDRDRIIHSANSWKHTNRYYTGTEDLDAYGQWRNVPDYGDVWVPNESQDWAPYREGNWTWEPFYGWTWVGYEPWGWAPYHYGRWFWYGNSWAWWPGPVGGFYRPFWAPAYVSFWGWGGGFGFGFGFGGWGGFGWLPIGPCDYFHPWWGGYRGRFGWVGRGGWYGGRYGGFRPLHAGNRFSNIANIHNEHIGRGLSTVGAGRFGAGRVSAVAATRQQIGGARMMAGNLPVVPSRASLSASGRAASPSTVRNGGSERFFGTHNNLAHPASFHQETAGLRQTMQQNHVSGIPAGGRMSGESTARGTNTMSNMQRSSAGAFSNRETNNLGARSAGNPSSSMQNGNRGESRPFTRPSGTARSAAPVNSERNNMGSPAASRDGFRPFTPPPSHSDMSRGASGISQGRASEGRSEGSYWNRTAPSSQMHTNGPAYGGSERGGSRPQLDMRQPIARSPYGGYPGGSRAPSYGGSRGVPSYGGSRGVPSYGGSHGAPGGGHVSAPSGGHSFGGGGGSHPSGGSGGHSSGGGHSGGGHH